MFLRSHNGELTAPEGPIANIPPQFNHSVATRPAQDGPIPVCLLSRLAGQPIEDLPMRSDSFEPSGAFGRKIGIAAALAMAALLGGCVAYPVGGGYYSRPYYAPPAYAVVTPPVIGYWGGGYGHHWR